MSTFDPYAFLDATITEPSTKRSPLPAGRDFVGIIGEVKARSWQGKKDPTQSGIAMDVPVEIDLSACPDVQIGANKVTLTDSIMLDLTPSGTIDNAPGKNGKLRRYREALDMTWALIALPLALVGGRRPTRSATATAARSCPRAGSESTCSTCRDATTLRSRRRS